MAFLSTTDFAQSKPTVAAKILGAIGGFFESVMEAQSRATTVQRLQDKSDAELAEFGVKREDIVRYVFRDIYHF